MRIILLVLVFLVVSCQENKEKTQEMSSKEISHLPYFNTPDFNPNWNKGTHKIPAFSFLNQNGDTINNDSYAGKIYVADFIFTTCQGICPKLTKNKNSLQGKYKADDSIMLLSHSVMPWKDTVEVLHEYAANNNVNSQKWHMLTGNKDSIYTLAREGYFSDEEFNTTDVKGEFIHTENFLLVDQKGYIRGVYNGTLEVDILRLMRHIEILKNEV